MLVQIRIDHSTSAGARLLQRASRYLDGETAVVERGHLAWMASRIALSSGDHALAMAMAERPAAWGAPCATPTSSAWAWCTAAMR
jgi:hypothetical protein